MRMYTTLCTSIILLRPTIVGLHANGFHGRGAEDSHHDPCSKAMHKAKTRGRCQSQAEEPKSGVAFGSVVGPPFHGPFQGLSAAALQRLKCTGEVKSLSDLGSLTKMFRLSDS